MTDDDRPGGLLAWQWRLYPDGHAERTNLAIHVATVPLFWLGTLAPLAAVLIDPWLSLGVLAMPLAIAAQGRGHAREATAPVPFRGPADVARRIVVEQWLTFPRFVLSGGLARAWRGQRASTMSVVAKPRDGS